MDEYPGNSIQGKNDPKIRRPVPTGEEPNSPVVEGEKKDIKKIVSGTAIRRKKGLLERTLGAFSTQGKTIYESVVEDILKPALKDTITDAIIQAVERAVHGEVRSTVRQHRRGPVGTSSQIAYNRYAVNDRFRDRPEPRGISDRGRGAHMFDEIELETRAEAQATLQQMNEIVRRYNTCSVADLYEMLDLPAEFTDERWGWTDLRGCEVRRTRSGHYTLILPPTEAL